MENNKLDNLFRSSLEDHEIKPPENSWSAIQADLKKKRPAGKKWRGLWFLTAALILPFLGYFAYQEFSKSPEAAPSTTQQQLVQGKAEAIASAEKIISNPAPEASVSAPLENSSTAPSSIIPHSSGASSATETNEPALRTEAAPPAIEHTEVINKPTRNQQSPAIPEAVIHSERNVAVMPSEPVGQHEVEVETAQAESTDEPSTEPAGENTSAQVTEEIITAESQPAPEEIAPTDAVLVEDVVTISSPSTTMPENENSQRKQDVSDAAAAPPTDSKTADVPGSANTQEQAVIPASEKTPAQENAEVTAVNTGNPANQATDSADYAMQDVTRKSLLKTMLSHLSFDIYFSPDYAKSRLESNADYTGSASTNINDYNNEKAKFSYSTGFHVRYDLGKRFSVGSGISYSTFDQTAVYNTISVVADSVYQETHGREPHGHGSGGPSGGPGHGHGHGHGHQGNNPHMPPGGGSHHFIIHTPCGAIDLYNEPPHGQANLRDGDTLQIKTETSETTRFIYIPLVFQYRFGNKKLSYFVEAGGAVNIVRSNSVKVVVNDAYVENNEHDGLKSSNYSLLFGAGANYNFYKGLSMFLKPSIRYSITPVNQNNPVNSYPYYLGVGAGFSIHF